MCAKVTLEKAKIIIKKTPTNNAKAQRIFFYLQKWLILSIQAKLKIK